MADADGPEAGSILPAARFDRVSVGYDRAAPVAHAVSWAVAAGEIAGLIALNGVGKTTLLKALVGLSPPLAGTVRVAGDDPLHPPARRAFAFVPEQAAPPGHLTGWEVARFTAAFYGLKLDRARALALGATLALPDWAWTRRVRTYSKGMGQKLSLIAALLLERPVLVLDEPMSGLDPRARAGAFALLEAERAAGRTVILTSHLLTDLDRLCDQVAVLHETQLRFVGPPAQLKAEQKAATLEAAFLARIGYEAPAPARSAASSSSENA